MGGFSFFEITDHLLDGRVERWDMLIADIENFFSIQIKIVVRDNVANSFDAFPVYVGIFCEQLVVGVFVEVFNAFANGDEFHTDAIELFQAFRGI